MSSRVPIRTGGLFAMLGGVLALALTLPFSCAYYDAYGAGEGEAPPPYYGSVWRAADELLTFAGPVAVYNTYGRVFALVYPLILIGVAALHSLHRRVGGRFKQWASRMLAGALLVTFVGVCGDYWADGAGWLVELLGLLLLLVGSVLYGIVVLRARVIPAWVSLLLVADGPAGIAVTLWPVGHIPSGPTVPIALAWVVLGYALYRRGSAFTAEPR